MNSSFFFHRCSSEVRGSISVGLRVNVPVEEEAYIKGALERKVIFLDKPIIVDVHGIEEKLSKKKNNNIKRRWLTDFINKADISMWGLKYYAFNLIWLVPTVATFFVSTKKSRKDE